MLFGDKSSDFFVAYMKLHRFLACELLGARLLGIEVVKPWLTREDFASLGDLESLGK